MKLQLLLSDVGQVMSYKTKRTDLSDEVTGVTDDTSKMAPGMIFVCIKGEKFDGHDFAKEMADKGAVCVVGEKNMGLGSKQIIVSDSRAFYGLLCAAWFRHPEKRLKLIGVTGTNGKTTMTSMIAFMLEKCRKKVGLIGTAGIFIAGKEISRDDSTPTTPKVSELYEILSKMVSAGCDYAVMEVTSFALEQNRIGPAVFDIGVFTNLTRDHLDYHKTMDSYYAAKKKLFEGRCKTAVINTADPYGARLYSEVSCEKYSYGVGNGFSVYADKITHGETGSKFWFFTTGDDPIGYPVTLNMVGDYNILNATAAIAVCLRLGMSVKDAAACMASFNGVKGRCEIIPTGRNFTVVCDYAHSPDALEKMLAGVKPYAKGKLICLFGCGGDRDATKRPLMAEAAEKFADRLIVTSDNPRNEDPDSIIDQIVKGFSPKTEYERITDRKEAIFHGIKTAEKGDVLVLAGKGHEDYQILAGGKHIHFDEREIVAEALEKFFGAPPVIEKQPKVKRETMTLDEICHTVRGKSYGAAYDPKMKVYIDEISSDTRTVKKGALFIGLKGENFNGSAFAENACNQKGAVCALADRIVKNCPCITVPDTQKALIDLAGFFRGKFSPVMVGITGSVGKTTSKDLTACALSSRYRTLKTAGNRNNHVGLPFTLLKLNSEVQAAVVEMGMNHSGEIDQLSRAARPDICIITNIGYSHIENLGSRKAILKAKLEILNGAKTDAPLIVNGDDPMLFELKEQLNRKVITCGYENKNCDYTAENILIDEEKTEFDICRENVSKAHCVIPAVGKHYVTDALLAAAAAETAGCKIASAAAAMKKYAPSGLRQHIEIKNGQKVIIDCYNAAPDSVKAAVDVLSTVSVEKGGKRICVFGDMLELGSFSQDLHKEVGEYAAKHGVDIIIAFGKFSSFTVQGAKGAGGNAFAAEKYADLMDLMRTYLTPGDAVLFKGSRAMRLEDAIEDFYKEDDE